MIRTHFIVVLIAGLSAMAAVAQAIDLTTAGHLSPADSTDMEQTRLARYLTILPVPTASTVRQGSTTHIIPSDPSYPGVHDYACYYDADNGQGYTLCDGITTDTRVARTWGYENGEIATGDYVGHRFKHAVTVSEINWINAVEEVSGTFASAPNVQVLNTPMELGGTWSTVAATWVTPYDSSVGTGIAPRSYQIQLDTPAEDVWGVRLFGLPNINGTDLDDDNGWISTVEMQVSGDCTVRSEIDLANNLALEQTPIWSATPMYSTDPLLLGSAVDESRLTDGLYGTNGRDGRTMVENDTSTTDFVGVKFDTAQSDVTAVGITMYYNYDGMGYLEHDTIDVQYTTDANLDPTNPEASTWTSVTGLDIGRLANAATEGELLDVALKRHVHSELLTFDEIQEEITGIRLYGTTAYDQDILDYLNSILEDVVDPTGYLDCQEFEVFATVTVEVPIPGDANDDDIVDAKDAEVLANNWGSSTVNGANDGDFNGDNIVNALDASIMAANWGDHRTESCAGAVPEPSMLMLLLIGAVGLLWQRGRRWNK